MGRSMSPRVAAFVESIVSIASREMVSTLRLSDDEAAVIARRIAHQVCSLYARSYLYIPADLEYQRARRDADIWAAYGVDGPDGVRKLTPQRERQLCREYSLTLVHVRSILQLMQRRDTDSDDAARR